MNFFNKNRYPKLSQWYFLARTYSLLAPVLFIILIPHLISAPFIISLYIIIISAWFFLHTLGVLSLPGAIIRFILMLLALLILLSQYGFFFSQQAFISLLSIMLCLKLLEIKNSQDKRNIFLILFLSYFVLTTHFLYSQSIFFALFAFLNSIILTLMLISFNRKTQANLSYKDNISLISHLFIKALPIAIMLFIFFPRIPGPLWSLPDNSSAGTTGLSDKMYPGSVSSLVDSNEVAFRVVFHNSVPRAEKLYWRGPVLSETDGFLWSQKTPIALKKAFDDVVRQGHNPVSYTITLEAHQQKWLFSLEMPQKIQADTIKGFYLSEDMQLLNPNNIQQLTQYHITSVTDFFLDQVTEDELQRALYLPVGSNPLTYQLGQLWQAQIKDPKKIIHQGLNYFKNQPFYYTKKPDLMIDNPSDQFLFDKRRGFCEHYASSFVLLMRAAGIPARVVTGYQGIEKNDIGNYYVVRQANAHAWAEVWIKDSGWLRVDPTAVIPAARIEADIYQNYLERLSFSTLNLPDLSRLTAQQKTTLYNFYKQIKQAIDNIQYSWNNWVLGYDTHKQNLLLKLLGLNTHWQTLIILLISSLFFLVLIFQLYSLYQQHKKIDKVYHYYTIFIAKLNRAGMSLSSSTGPEAIKQQAMNKLPEKGLLIENIMNNYIQIRYCKNANAELTQLFIRAVKNFS